jgi:hypothetical protein
MYCPHWKGIGLYYKARSVLGKSLKLTEQHYGTDHFQTARVICYLQELKQNLNNLDLAEEKINMSYQYLKAVDHDMYIPLEYLANLYFIRYKKSLHENDQKNSDHFKTKTLSFLQKTEKIIMDRFPSDSPHVKRIKKKLKQFASLDTQQNFLDKLLNKIRRFKSSYKLV